jgi:hypothetical protein
MVFIQTGHDQRAKNCQNRSAPPESPVSDGHAVKRLPPTIEKSETDQSVTDEVTGLPDDMMYLFPLCRVRGSEEMHPQRIEPSAGVRRRHGGGGLKGDHENAQRGWEPVQYSVQDWVQPEMVHVGHYKGRAAGRMTRQQARKLLEYDPLQNATSVALRAEVLRRHEECFAGGMQPKGYRLRAWIRMTQHPISKITRSA